MKDGLPYIERKPHSRHPDDTTTEIQTVEVDIGGKKLRVTNVYIPPIRQCKGDQREQKFEAEYLPWKYTDIIAGDMNAHAKEWDKTSSEDKMGRDIADCVENNRFNVLNNGQPTYLSRSHEVTSTPDVTLAKNMRRATAEWRRLDHTGTENIPINITVKFGSQAKVVV